MSKVSGEMEASVSGYQEVALGTLAQRGAAILAAATMVSGGTNIVEKSMHVITSVDQGDGPYLIGICTGALSAAQIEAAFENDGPSGPAHSTQTELSSRFRHIRILGELSPDPADPAATYHKYFEKTVKMGWDEQDAGWNYWIYNLGPVLVTGSTWGVTTMGSFVKFDGT